MEGPPGSYTPLPGFVWVSPNPGGTGDFRVKPVWNLIQNADGTFQPMAGFRWVAADPAKQRDYRVQPAWNLIANANGTFRPMAGFQWAVADPAGQRDYRVVPPWNLIDNGDGTWRPRAGFVWVVQDPAGQKDYRVQAAWNLIDNGNGTFNPMPGFVWVSTDPTREQDFRVTTGPNLVANPDGTFSPAAGYGFMSPDPARNRDYRVQPLLATLAGKAARSLDDFDTTAAVNTWDEAIRRYPDSAAAHAGMAGVLAARLRWSDAVTHAREWARLAPQDPAAHNNLAWWLLYVEGFQEALAEAEIAVRLDTMAAFIYDTYGVALARAGRFEEAEAALTRAVSLEPNVVEFRERLAQVQKRQQPVLPPRG